MPPVTAVMAWVLLGETLDVREMLGLVITVVGVAAATRGTRVKDDPAPEPVPETPSPGVGRDA